MKYVSTGIRTSLVLHSKYNTKAEATILRSLSRQHGLFSGMSACPAERDSTYHSSVSDWNSNDEFFKFTRGRFIVDEAENLRRREIRFDLSKLAEVAADSVCAAQSISIKKYPDGMFNKTFLLSMDNGREVVAKVPNLNAGFSHFTTASEGATMDFVCPS